MVIASFPVKGFPERSPGKHARMWAMSHARTMTNVAFWDPIESLLGSPKKTRKGYLMALITEMQLSNRTILMNN